MACQQAGAAAEVLPRLPGLGCAAPQSHPCPTGSFQQSPFHIQSDLALTPYGEYTMRLRRVCCLKALSSSAALFSPRLPAPLVPLLHCRETSVGNS